MLNFDNSVSIWILKEITCSIACIYMIFIVVVNLVHVFNNLLKHIGKNVFHKKKIDEDDIPPSVFWKCSVICLLCLLADSGVQTHIVLCFCFVCLRVMSSMLSVFLDCPFLIAPSVFCNVCVHLDTTYSKGTDFLCCSAYFVILFH